MPPTELKTLQASISEDLCVHTPAPTIVTLGDSGPFHDTENSKCLFCPSSPVKFPTWARTHQIPHYLNTSRMKNWSSQSVKWMLVTCPPFLSWFIFSLHSMETNETFDLTRVFLTSDLPSHTVSVDVAMCVFWFLAFTLSMHVQTNCISNKYGFLVHVQNL